MATLELQMLVVHLLTFLEIDMTFEAEFCPSTMREIDGKWVSTTYTCSNGCCEGGCCPIGQDEHSGTSIQISAIVLSVCILLFVLALPFCWKWCWHHQRRQQQLQRSRNALNGNQRGNVAGDVQQSQWRRPQQTTTRAGQFAVSAATGSQYVSTSSGSRSQPRSTDVSPTHMWSWSSPLNQDPPSYADLFKDSVGSTSSSNDPPPYSQQGIVPPPYPGTMGSAFP